MLACDGLCSCVVFIFIIYVSIYIYYLLSLLTRFQKGWTFTLLGCVSRNVEWLNVVLQCYFNVIYLDKVRYIGCVVH